MGPNVLTHLFAQDGQKHRGQPHSLTSFPGAAVLPSKFLIDEG
jgi:hypothetical protein